MKLKEYIEILSTFDQDVEVTKLVTTQHFKAIIKVERKDIFKPCQHFVRDKEGHEKLINCFVL